MSDIYNRIPEVQDVDWVDIFRSDPVVYGTIINDLIKIQVSEPGRPGKRSASSAEAISDDLRKLSNNDYSVLPLPDAFLEAKGERSYRQIANTSGLDKMTVNRLARGIGPPATPEQIVALAKGLKRDPSYFVEYRAHYVCSVLYKIMTEFGESATVFYLKMKETS